MDGEMSLLRVALPLVVLAGLSACASNPPTPDRAPIDYRGAMPGARPSPTSAGRAVASAAVPSPRVADVGISPTGASAIVEAKSLQPEAGLRPGGSLRQPKDDPSRRSVQVLKGDTLYDISRRYSVNMRALIEANRLEPPYALDAGKVIYLPPPNIHTVERGETLYSISRRYNVDTRSLALLNGIARPWTVWPGDEVLLPPLARDQSRTVAQAAPKKPPPVAAKPVSKPTSKATVARNEVEDKPIQLAKTSPAISQPRIAEAPAGKSDFIWPVSGPLLRGFGAGADGARNDGVNISVPAGTDVRAAGAGEVVYAGDELVGFGNLVLIRHAGGWISAYAHSDSLLVKEGDLVNQGQVIAKAGTTGNANTPQVHFELRKGKEPVDPAEHLPPLQG
jgi:murein DD-endopeptidase MepM/ murein hydrolase activator NlpD